MNAPAPPHSPAIEANFDGLVGPTHNYAGLAYGNTASKKNAEQPSNPRAAALQGLQKMKVLHDLGMAQGVLAPQERPNLQALRQLGFDGRDAAVLYKAHREAPHLLAAVSSASSMWTANAATVSPGADTINGKVHFTPANLCSNLHRSFEPGVTARILKAAFADPQHFEHHAPLPATPATADEGAANHTRFCSDYGMPGAELFVYGKGDEAEAGPKEFPARQTRAAGEAVARLHGLPSSRTLHAQQNPAVIDQGVFHNDVIAVGNRELLLYHEEAFVDRAGVRDWIRAQIESHRQPVFIEVAAKDISVEDAIASYLFNSQLICPPDDGMLMIVAQECQEHPRVWRKLQEIVADPANPISGLQVVDLRQSMKNGGGPACLRLRVVLNEAERAAVNPRCWLNDERFGELRDWITHHYRDRLALNDLADPALLDESRTALDRLTQILGLGSIYDFQR